MPSATVQNYVVNTLSKGKYLQHKRVLEMQWDFRKSYTGKRITTYNQFRKNGGKDWQGYKNYGNS